MSENSTTHGAESPESTIGVENSIETPRDVETPAEVEADGALADEEAADARESGEQVREAGAEDEGRLTASSEDADGEDAEVEQESPEEKLRRLEEEGDIAADYLEELMDIADLDGDIDIDVEGDRASVEIRDAHQMNRLNEPDGELMDALQELARLAVQTRTDRRSRLMLDIGGFRAQHRSSLEELAEQAVQRAREDGAPQPLRPMNPFERKVVHDVAKKAGLRSESDGDGRNRHVVIYPSA